jgi:hypothetical protein
MTSWDTYTYLSHIFLKLSHCTGIAAPIAELVKHDAHYFALYVTMTLVRTTQAYDRIDAMQCRYDVSCTCERTTFSFPGLFLRPRVITAKYNSSSTNFRRSLTFYNAFLRLRCKKQLDREKIKSQ